MGLYRGALYGMTMQNAAIPIAVRSRDAAWSWLHRILMHSCCDFSLVGRSHSVPPHDCAHMSHAQPYHLTSEGTYVIFLRLPTCGPHVYLYLDATCTSDAIAIQCD